MHTQFNESEAISKLVSLRLNNLKALKTEKEKALKHPPKGRLRVAKSSSGTPHFFLVNGKGNGKYVPKDKLEKAGNIAQRDYDKDIAFAIDNEIKHLQKFAANYKVNALENIWNDLNDGRKTLVKPVTIGAKEFAMRWQNEPYNAKAIDEESAIQTSSGLYVRSKSEVIIAETLTRLGVPFKYEYPLSIRGLGTFHPDFCCLNVQSRKEVIWEHFGMMDSPEYAVNATEKINLYAQRGFVLGDNFIATFETAKNPLNAKVVKELAERILL